MAHPLIYARELVIYYGANSPDRDAAVASIDKLIPLADADERQCRDCRETWYLAEDERQFFVAKGLREPVRCRACRRAVREAGK